MRRPKILRSRFLKSCFIKGSAFMLTFLLLISPLAQVYAQEISSPVDRENTVQSEIVLQNIQNNPDQQVQSETDDTENPGDTTVSEPTDDGTTIVDDTTTKDDTKDTDDGDDQDDQEKSQQNALRNSPLGPTNIWDPVALDASPNASQLVPEPDSSTGAMVYSYPLQVTPGRNGLQPNLKLQYSSQNTQQNSAFGYGWSVNIPYITRVNKEGSSTLFTDNYFASSVSGDLINTSGSIYSPATETGDFTKYIYTSNTWTATDKDGTIYTYGSSASTRQDDPGNSAHIYKWMLEKVQDMNGNFITYTYYKNGGQIYPDTITYTSNGANTGIFTVTFSRTSRSDTITDATPGFVTTTNYVISRIESAVSGTWVHRYDLSYTTQSPSVRSLLSSVTESGQTNSTTTTLPAETFTYQNTVAGAWALANPSWTMPADEWSKEYFSQMAPGSNPQVNSQDVRVSLNTSHSSDTSKAGDLIDVNGDGLKDIVQSYRCLATGCISSGNPGIDQTYVYINTGSGWVYDSGWTTPADEYSKDYYSQVSPGNNIQVNGHDVKVSLNTSHVSDNSMAGELIDVNGDGLVDIVQSFRCLPSPVGTCMPSGNAGIDKTYIYLNTGSGWVYDSSWTTPADEWSKEYYSQMAPGNNPQVSGHDVGVSLNTSRANDTSVAGQLADVNGDGLVDIIQSSRCLATGCMSSGHAGIDGIFVYVNTGSGWVYDSSWSVPADEYSKEFFSQVSPGNNPQVNSHDVSVSLSTAHYSDGSTSATLADVNGDGLMDIVQSYRCLASPAGTCMSSGNAGIDDVYVYINTGSGWAYDSSWVAPSDEYSLELYSQISPGNNPQVNSHDVRISLDTSYYTDNTVRGILADVNNDGLTDIVQSGRCLATGCVTGGNPGIDSAYIYINTGTGWVHNTFWTALPDDEYSLLSSSINSYPNPQVNSHDVSVSLNTSRNNDSSVGAGLSDMDGDGELDIVQSYRCLVGAGCSSPGIDGIFPYTNSAVAPLLSTITLPEGGSYSVMYKPAQQYANGGGTHLNTTPYTIQTLNQITVNDGTNTATTSYTYEGGKYFFDSADPVNRKFAGFHIVTKTDPAGNVTKTYYHQGDSSDSTHGEYNDDYYKIGRPYRVEQYDNSNSLYAKVINKWDEYSIATGTKFVKLTQSVASTYDGDSSHKDKATAYTYDNATGNVTSKVEYGVVSGNDDGTFTDSGTDDFTTAASYTNNTTDHIFLPYDVTVTDHSSAKVKEDKYYYDTQSLGTVTKGNQTKREMWKISSTFINIQRGYDATYGVPTSDTDARGKVTTYSLDANNMYPATVTDPLSNVTSYTYDYASGKPTQKTDANTRVYQRVYDGLNRVITEKQPDIASPGTLVNKTVYTYTDTSGAVKAQVTKYLDGSTSTNTYVYYDGLHRKIQSRKQGESDYEVQDFAYNNRGLLLKESLPYFSSGTSKTSATGTTSLYKNYTYDAMNRVSTVVDNIGTTSTAYQDWKTTITDPRGKTKDFYTDAYNNLIQIDEHNSANIYSTYYTYNGLNNLLTITDALGNSRAFTYDGLSRRLTAEDLHASGDTTFGSWSYTYDDASNMTQSVSPEAKTVNYTYDDINRVLTENYTGAAGTEITYVYDTGTDGIGHLYSVTMTGGANTVYTYDANNNTASEAKTIGGTTFTTSYTYDRQGNNLIITYPDSAQVRYTYNTAGLLDKVERKESGGSFSDVVSNIDYSPMEQVATVAYVNGQTTTNTYDDTHSYRLENKYTSALPLNNAPVISLTGAQLIDKNVGDTWTDPGYSATDVEDGSLTGSVSVTGSVNTAVAGTYQLVYSVVDSGSKPAARLIRTIVVHAPASMLVKTLVVGGGGAANDGNGGGGGGGGYIYDPAFSIAATAYSITVGNGGSTGTNNSGSSSVFSSLTAVGGGGAGLIDANGSNGGSGGGGGKNNGSGQTNGGTPTSGQGYAGGQGGASPSFAASGGGGGCGAAGTNGVSGAGGHAGNGGNGVSNSISGSSVTYCGGGAGHHYTGAGTNGTGQTGPGGGGDPNVGSGGQKGIVIISYHTDGSDGVNSTSTGGTKTTSGVYTIHTFTNSGTFTANAYTVTNNIPTITLSGSSLINLTVGATWTDPGYSATDAEDGTITGSVTTTGSVNTASAGTYQIVYAVVDSAGASAARKIRTVVVNSSGAYTKLQDATYTYDANNNITQVVDASDTDGSKTVNYVYDDLNRMTSATATAVAAGQSTYTQTYAYNAIGNITSGPVGSYVYNGSSGSNWANPHAATSINSVTNTYDKDGNNLTDGTLTNTWNYKDQLATSTDGVFTRTYAYDHAGSRVSSSDGTTTTKYANKLYNTDGTKKTKSIYAGDQLIATIETVSSTVTPRYVHADYLNSANVVSDASGNSVELLDYFPFGGARVSTGSYTGQKQYLSQVFDLDTSLNYLQARYFQSSTGRFISQDPVFWELGISSVGQQALSDPQSMNSYSYSGNNPITRSDPNGKWYQEFLANLNPVSFGRGQSWSSFQGELGQATQYLTDHSQAWSFAVDHPVATGAITAVASVPAVIAGESAAAAYGMATFPGVGTTFATQQAIAGTVYSGLTVSSTLAIPELVKPFSKADSSKPSSFYPAAFSVAKEVGISIAGRQVEAIGGATDVMQVGGMIGKAATNFINNLFSSSNSQKSSDNKKK